MNVQLADLLPWCEDLQSDDSLVPCCSKKVQNEGEEDLKQKILTGEAELLDVQSEQREETGMNELSAIQPSAATKTLFYSFIREILQHIHRRRNSKCFHFRAPFVSKRQRRSTFLSLLSTRRNKTREEKKDLFFHFSSCPIFH